VSQKTFDALDVSEQQAFVAAAAKFAGRFEDLGRREDGLLFGGMLEKQGVKRLAASEALRAGFLDAAAAARTQIDEQTIPKSLIKDAIDAVNAFRAAHKTRR